jgi:hypothetical protein
MMFLSGMLWGCIGSMEMLGDKETKSPTNSEEAALL